MSTLWSVILNRMDKVGQKFWTEWRAKVVDASTGAADAGAIPMLGPDGKIDSSMLPGGGGGSDVVATLTAAQNINAFQVVAVHTDGLAYLADASVAADDERVIGLSITSATTGGTIQVQQIGPVTNLGWAWTPGMTLYLGLNGTLVTTVPSLPTSVFELSMGTTISATEIEVQIGTPIVLA
jgi:hypothetical protein